MKTNLKIKVCGMRHTQNIKDLGKLKPDYMGFIFYPKSSRFVKPEQYKTIANAVPKSIEKVGVFVNELIPEIINTTTLFGIKTLQIHGNENPEYCAVLKEIGFTIIKAFGIDEDFDFAKLSDYSSCCDYYLFDTKSKSYGGSGAKFNWDILKGYDNEKPIFLSGGINSDDAGDILAINKLNIHALDLNSKFEIEPAVKDIDKLRVFINKIRN